MTDLNEAIRREARACVLSHIAQNAEMHWFPEKRETVEKIIESSMHRIAQMVGEVHKHTDECLAYAAKTGKAFCIAPCRDSRTLIADLTGKGRSNETSHKTVQR